MGLNINIDAKEVAKQIISKATSARFIMAVLFSLTYCAVIIACTIALLKKILTVETYVALLGAFALVVREIVSDYFKREDRAKENGGEPK